MRQCNLCGHINGHAYGCPEAPQPEYECCSECGNPIYNGEPYYEFNNEIICEDCLNDAHKHLMDYDDNYTYQDYLNEKYERERHDI